MENTKSGRRRERRWTPTRSKAQDTRASPNTLETHLVRKRWDIGLLRALRPWLYGWMEFECHRKLSSSGPVWVQLLTDKKAGKLRGFYLVYFRLKLVMHQLTENIHV